MQAKYLIFLVSLAVLIAGCIDNNAETIPKQDVVSSPSQESCTVSEQIGFPESDGLSPVDNDFSVKEDGSVTIALKNNLGRDVSVISLSGDAGTSVLNPPVELPAGKMSVVSSLKGSLANIAGARSSPNCYEETVTITYTTADGIQFRSSGMLRNRKSSGENAGRVINITDQSRKIACAYADIQADPNFAKYDKNTGLFSVLVRNTGTEDLSVQYFVAEYSGGRVSKKMQLKDADALSLKKSESKTFGPIDIFAYASDTSKSGITASLADIPDKITLSALECENAKTIIYGVPYYAR